MSRAKRIWNEKTIQRKIAEGDGCGVGSEYKPWLTVRDISSRGNTSRIPSWKVRRSITVFSDLERTAFQILERDSTVIAIYEQFPIPREYSIDAANELDIRHPRYVGSGAISVMTVDFLVEATVNDQVKKTGYNVKYANDAQNPRSIEKLAIQEKALQHMDADHKLFLNTEITPKIVANIGKLRGALPSQHESPGQTYWFAHAGQLHAYIQEQKSNETLRDACQSYEVKNELKRGTAIRAAHILLYHNRLSLRIDHSDYLGARLREMIINPLAGNSDAEKSNLPVEWTAAPISRT